MPEEQNANTTTQTGGGGKTGGSKPGSSPGTGGTPTNGGGKPQGGGKPSPAMTNVDTPAGGGPAPAGGKPGNPFMSGTPGYQPGGSFYDFQAAPVAGANPLQNAAGALGGKLPTAGQGGVQGAYGALGQAGQMFGQSGQLNPLYQQMVSGAGALGQLPGQTQEAMDMYRQLPGIAGRQVTGENVANDPAIKAANDKFMEVMAPMIKDSAGLAGLGRSGVMTNALSSQQAQTLLPLIQDSMGREERGIDRLLGGTQAGAAGLFGGGQQANQQLMQQLGIYGNAGAAQQQGQQFGAQGMAGIGQALAGLGGQEQGMLMNAISGLSGLGGQFRDIEQQMLNAPVEEQHRLWSEALNQIYGPFGMIPGMTGSAGTSTGGKK